MAFEKNQPKTALIGWNNVLNRTRFKVNFCPKVFETISMHMGRCLQGLIIAAPRVTPGQLQVSELELASGSAWSREAALAKLHFPQLQQSRKQGCGPMKMLALEIWV